MELMGRLLRRYVHAPQSHESSSRASRSHHHLEQCECEDVFRVIFKRLTILWRSVKSSTQSACCQQQLDGGGAAIIAWADYS